MADFFMFILGAAAVGLGVGLFIFCAVFLPAVIMHCLEDWLS